MVTMVRVSVVPTDQVGGREGSVQRFARNAHRVIALATDCVDDLVVAGAQVLDGDVSAKFYVAKETHPRVRGHLLVGGGDALDVLMIRCNAAANHAERRRQPIEHIHTHGQVRRFEQRLCSIEPRWSRPNDGDAEWAFDRAKGAHTSSWIVSLRGQVERFLKDSAGFVGCCLGLGWRTAPKSQHVGGTPFLRLHAFLRCRRSGAKGTTEK